VSNRLLVCDSLLGSAERALIAATETKESFLEDYAETAERMIELCQCVIRHALQGKRMPSDLMEYAQEVLSRPFLSHLGDPYEN
jgi:hypothetical protein